jgi:hypothetical protein
MRFARLVFAGSLAAAAAISVPALAKSSDHQKAEEKSATSAGCQAYQQAADGTWNKLSCDEAGPSGATEHRTASKGAESDEH